MYVKYELTRKYDDGRIAFEVFISQNILQAPMNISTVQAVSTDKSR